MDCIEMLKEAKKLLVEAESALITEKGFCPYELGYSLRSLDATIEKLELGDL